MRFLGFLPWLWVWATPVHAADVVPETYLPDRVQGVFLTGLTERTPFGFTAPKPSECERKEVGKLVFLRCKASGGELRLEGTSDEAPSIHFTGVNVFYKPTASGGVLREYHFAGFWTEKAGAGTRTTKLALVFYRWSDTAANYYGFVELADWGYSARLLAPAN